VLLAAGMPADALGPASAALAGRITATKKAELMLAAARTALAASRPSQAAERAVMSRSMFTAQQREWWRTQSARTRPWPVTGCSPGTRAGTGPTTRS